MLLLGSNSTGSHASGDIAEAVDFDGTNDYLSRSSDLTGNADGKTFTFSCWVWLATSTDCYLYRILGTSASYIRAGSGSLAFYFENSSSTAQLAATVSGFSGVSRIGSWHHILISVDLSSTSNRSVYVDGESQTVSWNTYVNGAIDFTNASHYINSLGSSSDAVDCRLSHLFLDYTYRNLSTESERRKFITADRKPADNQAALNPILYLPMTDPATVHINEGTGGNFTLNGVVARSGRGANQFNVPYSDLDGSADYLSRTTAPTGIADGKQFTFACVLNQDNSADYRFLDFGDSATRKFSIFTPTLTLYAVSPAGAEVLVATATVLPINRNVLIVLSIDLSDPAKRHVFINGVSQSMTWTTYVNDDVDFTYSIPRFRVGASIATTPSNYFNGRLGNVFFHTTYIDLSVPANLAKFCTGTGIDCKPVDMGANGELPLGTSPLIYLPMYANNAGKNYGTGGDFTVNSGPYIGARGPNEYFGNKWDFNGTTSYAYRTSALAGVSDGKTFSCVFWVSFDVLNTSMTLFNIGSSSTGISILKGVTNYITLSAFNSDPTRVLLAPDTVALSADTQYLIMVCIDLTSTSKRFVYINDLARSMTWTTYTNSLIDFTLANCYVGSGAGAGFVNGKLSEFYFTTSYIDFSQEANRLKFRDAFGSPVDLTAQIEAGEIPEPAIYMRFPPDNPGKNYGTGGDFTPVAYVDGGQL